MIIMIMIMIIGLIIIIHIFIDQKILIALIPKKNKLQYTVIIRASWACPHGRQETRLTVLH